MEAVMGYTLNEWMSQKAEVERDAAALDAFGGEPKADRKVVATIKCRFYWWRERGGIGPAREYATPERTIHFAGGGITAPLGANLKPGDHLVSITERGEVVVEGPFRVVAVQQLLDHLDAELMRP